MRSNNIPVKGLIIIIRRSSDKYIYKRSEFTYKKFDAYTCKRSNDILTRGSYKRVDNINRKCLMHA